MIKIRSRVLSDYRKVDFGLELERKHFELENFYSSDTWCKFVENTKTSTILIIYLDTF